MKKLIVVITLLLLSGCTINDQQAPKKGPSSFESPCGPMRTLVCFERIDRQCYCEDPLKMQKELEQRLNGNFYG